MILELLEPPRFARRKSVAPLTRRRRGLRPLPQPTAGTPSVHPALPRGELPAQWWEGFCRLASLGGIRPRR